MPTDPELEKGRHDALVALGHRVRVRDLRLARFHDAATVGRCDGHPPCRRQQVGTRPVGWGVSNVAALAGALG